MDIWKLNTGDDGPCEATGSVCIAEQFETWMGVLCVVLAWGNGEADGDGGWFRSWDDGSWTMEDQLGFIDGGDWEITPNSYDLGFVPSSSILVRLSLLLEDDGSPQICGGAASFAASFLGLPRP